MAIASLRLGLRYAHVEQNWSIGAAVDELIKYRITPEVNTSGTQINVIDIFLSVDPSEFEAVDTDPGTAGIQPFSLGDNSNISSDNVNQAAYEMNGRLYLDFTYSDVTSGLTFFDGSQVLAIANLRARSLDNLGDAGEGEEGQEGGSSSTGYIVNTTITLDNSGNFDINIYGITTAGAAGAPDFSTSSGSEKNLWAQGGSSFVFLSGTTVNWHGGSEWSSAQLNDYFVINDDAFAYHNNMWGGDWTVSYSSGDFSLNFSAVPEPSTYFMITGLLLLPGFRFLKGLRGGKDKGEE